MDIFDTQVSLWNFSIWQSIYYNFLDVVD
jgi:hypothetical protein